MGIKANADGYRDDFKQKEYTISEFKNNGNQKIYLTKNEQVISGNKQSLSNQSLGYPTI